MTDRDARKVLTGALVLGALLRAWGLWFGLPHDQARPDESVAVAKALLILQGDPNPHFFHWPSLHFYVLADSFVLGFFVYSANLSFILSPQSISVPSWIYVGSSGLSLSSLSPVEVSGYKPYALRAIVRIDGADYSPDIYDAVTVSKEEDAAATFSFSLNSNSTPGSFLDKEVKISFQAADSSGTVVNVIDLMVGKIRDVEKDIDGGGLHLSGYDYGAIHNNPGELSSGDVTNVHTGNLYINASGTFNIGKNPIWDVVCGDVEGVEDGKDYFVDTLNGIIYIPFNSKFITTPGTLNYKYGAA